MQNVDNTMIDGESIFDWTDNDENINTILIRFSTNIHILDRYSIVKDSSYSIVT